MTDDIFHFHSNVHSVQYRGVTEVKIIEKSYLKNLRRISNKKEIRKKRRNKTSENKNDTCESPLRALSPRLIDHLSSPPFGEACRVEKHGSQAQQRGAREQIAQLQLAGGVKWEARAGVEEQEV